MYFTTNCSVFEKLEVIPDKNYVFKILIKIKI